MNINPLSYQYIYNGGGVAIGDINNDGLSDIYFSGNLVEDKLYLNKGNMKFEDISLKAQIGMKNSWSTGVTMADVNADGYLDIYVCRAGPALYTGKRKNLLYINNQDLTFTEKAEEYGLADDGLSTQAAFFDLDKDGDLDAYVMNIPELNPLSLNDNLAKEKTHKKSDHIYKNNHGTFIDISEQLEVIDKGFGLGLSISDFNSDGYPEVYIANDYEDPDILYWNYQGKLIDEIKERTKHTSNLGMGTDIADINNDAHLDLMELDMAYASHVRSKTNMANMSTKKFRAMIKQGYQYQYMYNSLQINNGNNTFSDISQLAGVAKTNWSWAILLADLDNDGWKDGAVTNGYQRDISNRDFQNQMLQTIQKRTQPLINEFKENPTDTTLITTLKDSFQTAYLNFIKNAPKQKENNILFRNNKNLTFSNVSAQWGFEEQVNSNGMAYADLDNDGDLDLVINNLNQVASVYENQSNKNKCQSNYLQLSLKGTASNPFAIGAKATIRTGNTTQVLELFPTRGFQSSVDYRLHFGLGSERQVDWLQIQWPDLSTSTLKQVPANQLLQLSYENRDASPKTVPQKVVQPLIEPVTAFPIQYQHKENIYDDFQKEVLLPHQLSRSGPSIAVGDLNGDSLEDIVLGGSANVVMSLYQQQTDGRFKKVHVEDFYHDIKCEDSNILLIDIDQDNDLDIYVASGSNEYPEGHGSLQDRLYINQGGRFKRANHRLPIMTTSTYALSAADVDQDGDLDLFVGGRLTPGKYPMASRSYLLLNEDGKFRDATSEYSEDLLRPGMVTGATFGDVDGDGRLDLSLIGEWMPLKIFLGKDGKLVLQKSNPATEGLWFSLKAADLDNDGDLDFVAGNLGKNCKFKGSKHKPFNIYADDFDNNGSWDMMMSSYEGSKNYPVRGRDCSSEQMPFITERFPTFQSFATAEITDICGPKIKESLHLTARGFYTAVLINGGNGKFSLKKLPPEAQFAPTMDILIEDLNQDQHLDLILVGNMYHAEIETVRYDAGRGTVLLGNGKGDFEALSPNESGLFAWDNVKFIRKINHQNAEHYLMTVNNGKLLAFKRKTPIND